MNNIFQVLDNDTDVVLFEKDTYTVGRLKELIHNNFGNKFYTQFANGYQTVASLIQSVSINEAIFKVEDITWKSSCEGRRCQILRVGSRGWETGRLRIITSTEITTDNRITSNKVSSSPKVKIQVIIEFCPDELLAPESPLDDIRKMMQAT
ncbi:hypothetical protein HCG51_25695 [Tolypothrix sp. PCC 7910]|uniref:KGK domain-containing protein n=1 Tax=Tolypothrix sp. PCC 7910 TaxID=2099387 RepID=UPI001427733E|nr:KGK domain-containing protein [Tolypothrix sp. PCC 7910]QIR41598.1 hypothetical protein HCG51_25695 [Tolypothrix sp. PCC 7910]